MPNDDGIDPNCHASCSRFWIRLRAYRIPRIHIRQLDLVRRRFCQAIGDLSSLVHSDLGGLLSDFSADHELRAIHSPWNIQRIENIESKRIRRRDIDLKYQLGLSTPRSGCTILDPTKTVVFKPGMFNCFRPRPMICPRFKSLVSPLPAWRARPLFLPALLTDITLFQMAAPGTENIPKNNWKGSMLQPNSTVAECLVMSGNFHCKTYICLEN